MTLQSVTLRVPATTANLGPGFDCLALVLDLWNTCTFMIQPGGVRVEVQGEGAGHLPIDDKNLIARAFFKVYRRLGQGMPPGVKISCDNRIPLGSGLGSSAGAALAGIVAANTLLGDPLTKLEMLEIAYELEGHADNAAAALYGGLTLVTSEPNGSLIVQPLPSSAWQIMAVLPDFPLPTVQARRALPEQVSLQDAVFNIGHAILAADALRSGDRGLLTRALQDRLHQSYRLELIPGAAAAIQAAQALGAPAALSGAGPSVIAFAEGDTSPVQAVMQNAFTDAGLTSRAWNLKTSTEGLTIDFS